MWKVRLADAKDYADVRDMAEMNWQESCPEREWSEDKMRATFHESYLRDSSAIIFIVEKDGEPAGFLLTSVFEYRAFIGLFTVQEVIFIKPERRGTRAAALLMKKLIEWSRDVVGAQEIIGGNDNDLHSEQTARFLSRFGFRQCGYAMRLELNGR